MLSTTAADDPAVASKSEALPLSLLRSEKGQLQHNAIVSTRMSPF